MFSETLAGIVVLVFIIRIDLMYFVVSLQFFYLNRFTTCGRFHWEILIILFVLNRPVDCNIWNLFLCKYFIYIYIQISPIRQCHMSMFQPSFHSTPVGRVWTPMTQTGMENTPKLVPACHFPTLTGPSDNQVASTSVPTYLPGPQRGTTIPAAVLFQSYVNMMSFKTENAARFHKISSATFNAILWHYQSIPNHL